VIETAYRSLWLLTSGDGTGSPNRDVGLDGETWRVSGLVFDITQDDPGRRARPRASAAGNAGSAMPSLGCAGDLNPRLKLKRGIRPTTPREMLSRARKIALSISARLLHCFVKSATGVSSLAGRRLSARLRQGVAGLIVASLIARRQGNS